MKKVFWPTFWISLGPYFSLGVFGKKLFGLTTMTRTWGPKVGQPCLQPPLRDRGRRMAAGVATFSLFSSPLWPPASTGGHTFHEEETFDDKNEFVNEAVREGGK